MQQYNCQIVPNYLLKKLGKKTQIVKSHMVRSKRSFLLQNPEYRVIPKKTHQETRRLFDSKNEETFSTKPIAIDSQIHSTEKSKYYSLELANKVYDYFHNDHNMESWDNQNSPVDVHIHYGYKYDNAFWDGEKMVFGDGDGEIFKSFLTQNVFTHEFTHAVTETNCGLIYESQSGALNESLSDIFAVCLDQKIKNQTPDKASWVIGEGVFTKRVKGKGLRTFKDELAYNDPVLGKDEQPKNMRNYQDLPITEDGDWGGVHVNSGIINHFFYQLCTISNLNSFNEPSQIIFQSYRMIKPKTNFKEFATATIKTTKNVYPSLEKEIREAWKKVGLL